MSRLSNNQKVQVGTLLAFVLGVALLGGLALRFARFSGRATGGVALQCFGQATNFLVQPGRTWAAFSISNGTSKALFYYASGVDYRSPTGWVSRPLTGTSVEMSSKSSFVVAPSNSANFFASIPAASIPWRLRVTYREAGLWGASWTSFHNLSTNIPGLPPSNTTAWSGRRQEVVSTEITP